MRIPCLSCRGRGYHLVRTQRQYCHTCGGLGHHHVHPLWVLGAIVAAGVALILAAA